MWMIWKITQNPTGILMKMKTMVKTLNAQVWQIPDETKEINMLQLCNYFCDSKDER